MAGVHRLSSEEIMRVSRARFSQISSQQYIDLSTIQHFFDASHFGLSNEEIKDVELALLLLASAYRVSNQQFDDASKLLKLCDFLSSNTGNSVQSVVHYFTKALQERISRGIGIVSLKGFASKERLQLHPAETTIGVNPALISCSLQLPCIQVTKFAGIQAVIGRICTVLMQALANRQECPVELLNITAVGINASRQNFEETGKRLACFVENLNLLFLFQIATFANIKDLKEDMFELSKVKKMVKAQAGCLPPLLRVLKNLNPCVLVMIELEANHSSPTFIDQFVEALQFYSLCYDCIRVCIDQDDQNRIAAEAFLGQEIKDIVAAEGEEWICQHMKIDEWRAYFTRLGMVEIEVSRSCFDQAELLLQNFASRKSCLLVRNGKCLNSGWKGTPHLSVSAWKFHQGQSKRRCTKKCKN
ncbi:hypothetical protein P3X46_005871 [Hevea brasiliensis]|uniref:DELLA protein n=1 Tax=Hevea brasiliensis TaxID=3981 RepID=A0ABQ9MNC7_HEVBR|nr:hypothetical protein P3X46_005871 [Hevea brasiliensis]